MKSNKRFIAGAVCPRCGEMDKLVVYKENEDSYKECVSCDFKEKQVVQVELSELSTRVNNMPEDGRENEETQVVTLLDPRKLDPKKLH